MRSTLLPLVGFLVLSVAYFGGGVVIGASSVFHVSTTTVAVAMEPVMTHKMVVDVTIPTTEVDPGYSQYFIAGNPHCNAWDPETYECTDQIPNLCSYLSIELTGASDGDQSPYSELNQYFAGFGSLTPPEDPSDAWAFTIHAPCFAGECPLGYDSSVSGNPLPQSLKGQTFRCDVSVDPFLAPSTLGTKTAYAQSASDMPENVMVVTAIFGATSTPTVPTCTENCNSNVMFLPGIMGSRLFQQDTDCGLGSEQERWVSGSDCDHTYLALDAQGKSIYPLYTKEGDGGVVDDTYIISSIYESFMNDLDDWKNDDQIIADYAIVPYDWRLSLEDILQNGASSTNGTLSYATSQGFYSAYLYQTLARLAQSSRTGKVSIVGHSNGGLVAKALIQKLKDNNDPLYNKIDDVILVAVPQSGTPETVGNLLHGGGIGPLGSVMSAERVRDLLRNMPFAYNLLPSQALVANSSPLVEFDGNATPSAVLSQYGNTIDTYEELREFLLGAEGRTTPAYDDLASATNANEALLSGGEAVHSILDSWTPSASTTVYEIAGWGLYTPAGLKYERNLECIPAEQGSTPPVLGVPQPLQCAGYQETLKLSDRFTLNGDKTVVGESAHHMDASSTTQKWWMNLAQYRDDAIVNRDHKDILEVDELRTFLRSIITQNIIIPTYITPTSTTLVSEEVFIKYSLHSPLNIHLYDAVGHHTGISSTTGLVEEGIKGSLYFSLGETKTILVPAGTPHTMKLDAYASGSFTLDLETLQGDAVVASTTFEAIPVATTTEAKLEWIPEQGISSTTALSVDFNGDAIIDSTLESTVGGTTVYDGTPPEGSIGFSTSTRQLLVVGVDETGSTIVHTTATSTTIIDQVGNSLVIPFLSYKEKNRRLDLSFNTLVYNGNVTLVPTTTLKYKWNVDKKGKYTMFATYLKTGTTTIETHYRPKRNVTILMQKPLDLDDNDNDDDCDTRPIRTVLPGMVVVGVGTDEGMLKVNY